MFYILDKLADMLGTAMSVNKLDIHFDIPNLP